MKKRGPSRRGFLAGSVSAWLAASWPGIVAAQEHVHRLARSGAAGKFEFFSPEQAAEVEAVAAQIIPSDDSPGAREARIIHFIDRALHTFDRDKQPVYTEGLRDLQAKTAAMFPGVARFSALTSEQQIELLKSIEKTPFFGMVRTHTIVGFFANPEYGGNYEKTGWRLIGFDDAFHFQPPFGYYDREYKGA